MDILDTFGDWVQLFVFFWVYAIGIGMLMGIAHGLRRSTGIPMTLSIIGINYILWISVYDYDIVIAYILAAIYSIVFGLKDEAERRGTMLEDLHFSRALCGLVTLVVMITKIVKYW